MKISVALACYNGEKYIIDQLHSIMEQTRQVDEVIINDDCSPDKTAELVKNFISKNNLKSWRIKINDKNLGFAENFRNAIDQCTGDVIFLCDQDDIWISNRVEVMMSIMELNPDVGLLNTEYITFKDSVVLPTIKDGSYNYQLKKINLNRRTFFLRYPGCVMCFRKSFYDSIKEYWSYGWSHDAFLWAASLMEKCCYKLDYCSLCRRVHANQTSGRVGHSINNRIRYLQSVTENSFSLLKMANERNKSHSFQKLYLRMETAHLYRLEIVRDKKWIRLLQLIPYLSYYKSAKSYFIELAIALKGDL